MGRAMLLISAGAVVVLGLLQVGIQSQRLGITQATSTYAYDVQIKNKAYTAVQLAMERINESGGSWHPTKNNPWTEVVDGDSISLYYELFESSGSGTFASLNDDTVQIHASSWYRDFNSGKKKVDSLTSTFSKHAMHFVPEFKSALSFAVESDDFSFSLGGSATVNGNDASGTCGPRPAIAVRDSDSAENINDGAGSGDGLVSDSTDVAVDPELSYQPVDELVARLAQNDDVVTVSGNYKDDFGSPENPGIFFVEDKAKLTGGVPEGYGIMVIRSGGELEYEGELDVAGNFTFNGLVIFENAYNFRGRGTPRINGSVLVGKADDTNEELDVDLSGTIDIQYDCTAEKYAQLASANSLNQNRYKRLSTYE